MPMPRRCRNCSRSVTSSSSHAVHRRGVDAREGSLLTNDVPHADEQISRHVDLGVRKGKDIFQELRGIGARVGLLAERKRRICSLEQREVFGLGHGSTKSKSRLDESALDQFKDWRERSIRSL